MFLPVDAAGLPPGPAARPRGLASITTSIVVTIIITII